MPTTTYQQHTIRTIRCSPGSFPAYHETASANSTQPAFENPFTLTDLLALDDDTLGSLLLDFAQQHGAKTLAWALIGASSEGANHAQQALSMRRGGDNAQQAPAHDAGALAQARQWLLDACFWELTYWKTPQLYEALTEGERIHPGVWRRLAPWLRGALVLDAGAGCGRAAFACLSVGARHIYAVEPSPEMLLILNRKIAQARLSEPSVDGSISTNQPAAITPLRGRFDHLPLPDHSVDLSLSCSAFTAELAHGGERGLAELLRVTRPGGHIVIIWPRPADYAWLAAHGFAYASVHTRRAMAIRFRSRERAVDCAHRFYARHPAVIRYLEDHQTRELPFSVLGVNPPIDYCWRAT